MPTSTSTSMSISQFLALRVSELQVSGVQVSEPLDRDPDLAVGVAVGVAVGDARSPHLSRPYLGNDPYLHRASQPRYHARLQPRRPLAGNRQLGPYHQNLGHRDRT